MMPCNHVQETKNLCYLIIFPNLRPTGAIIIIQVQVGMILPISQGHSALTFKLQMNVLSATLQLLVVSRKAHTSVCSLRSVVYIKNNSKIFCTAKML